MLECVIIVLYWFDPNVRMCDGQVVNKSVTSGFLPNSFVLSLTKTTQTLSVVHLSACDLYNIPGVNSISASLFKSTHWYKTL